MDKQEEDLLCEIGAALAAERSAGLPFDRQELVHLARTWMKQRHSEIQLLVCEHSAIRELYRTQRLTEALAITVDVLLQKYGQVPCAAIARLLFFWGLDNFCQSAADKGQG